MKNYFKDPKLTLALYESSNSLRNDFCSCCKEILFLEPNEKNNYIWAIVDLTGYDQESIKGAEQQLIAIEKDYIK